MLSVRTRKKDLSSHAQYEQHKGRLERAEALYRKALEERLAALTTEPDDSIAKLHNQIGEVLEDQERYEEAEREYTKAREIYSLFLSPWHPAAVKVAFNLARISEKRGDWYQAAARYRSVNISQILLKRA